MWAYHTSDNANNPLQRLPSDAPKNKGTCVMQIVCHQPVHHYGFIGPQFSSVFLHAASGEMPCSSFLPQAQQAAFDLRTQRGAASGLGSGARLAALSGISLGPAVGTLVTVDATTEYKTYSDLADQAVESEWGVVSCSLGVLSI